MYLTNKSDNSESINYMPVPGIGYKYFNPKRRIQYSAGISLIVGNWITLPWPGFTISYML